MAVSRADLAEVFLRPAVRPAAAQAKVGAARFTVESAERKPAAPARPIVRREEPTPADRTGTEAGKEVGKEASRTDRAGSAESRPSARPAERAPQTKSAQGNLTQARTARDHAASAPGRAQDVAAKPEARLPERADAAGPAQQASAEKAAAEETGAASASETVDEKGESDEASRDAEDAAAKTDPGALLAPPLTPPAPSASPAVSSPVAGAGTGAGEGGKIEGGAVAAGSGPDRGVTAAADGAASVPQPGEAGFDAVLVGSRGGVQDAAQALAQALPASSAAGTVRPAGGMAAADGAALPQPPVTSPIPLSAVPMTIGLRSLSGMNRFAIRLDPVELGRIDVSLDLDKEGGKARAHLVVDRPETLALLQRDASSLQQALAQAGFEAGAEAGGGIDLSLRGETGSQGGRDGEPSSRGRSEGPPGGRAEVPSPLDLAPLRPLRAAGNLDIRI
ncbi:flagellar hook-length control protein FliK [Methylorubrum zatmanii]